MGVELAINSLVEWFVTRPSFRDAFPDDVRIPLANAIRSDSCTCTRRRALPKIRARFPCIASVSAEEQAGRKSACKGLLVQRIEDHVPPACVGPVVGGLHRRLATVPERHSSQRLARAADDARRFSFPARCRVSHSRLPARAREGFAGIRQAAVLLFPFFRRPSRQKKQNTLTRSRHAAEPLTGLLVSSKIKSQPLGHFSHPILGSSSLD